VQDFSIKTAADFLEIYRRKASESAIDWRSVSITTDVCLALLKDGFSPETLLLNKKLPLDVLKVLSTNSDPRIRCMVADKRSAGALLQPLASDPEIAVRLRVAWNAKVPPGLLEAMLNDPAADVRETARLRLSQLKSGA